MFFTMTGYCVVTIAIFPCWYRYPPCQNSSVSSEI